jgi:FAD:protein FMN transferase
MKIKSLCITVLLFISLLFVSCSDNTPFETQGFSMGTVITERVFGKNSEKAAGEVLKRISVLDKMMTINSPGGDINHLNSNAGKDFVKISNESMFVLGVALKYAKLSEGEFDITIGPLVKAWLIGTDNPRIPERSEIDSLLKLTDYNDLILDGNNGKAKLLRKGQIVDLGGIAKGYAGDESIKIFRKHGISSAYVNLGGNVVVLGKKPDGSLWNIGIQNPRSANGSYIGILHLSDMAVVTSGDYERFFEKDGIRYHHILDKRTGYPARSGLISATIVYKSSIDADALSTSVFILGMNEGYKVLKTIKGAEAVFITDKKEIYITNGLKDIFTFSDSTNEFSYKGVIE